MIIKLKHITDDQSVISEISFSEINGEFIDALASGLYNGVEFREFKPDARDKALGVLEILKTYSHITHIDLRDNKVPDLYYDAGIAALAGLASLPNLSHLNLSGNFYKFNGKLDDRDVTNISSALAGLTHLTCLDLSRNGFGSSFHKVIGALAGLPRLTELNLALNITSINASRDAPAVISALTGLTHLTKLDLSGNHLGYYATQLSKVLGSLTNITDLNLRHNDLGRDAPAVISALGALLPQLTKLDLGSNDLGYYATEVSEVLPSLTNITDLNLSHNGFGSSVGSSVSISVDKVIGALASLSQLTKLNLRNNNFGDYACAAAKAGVLPVLTNVTHLDLCNNHLNPKYVFAALPIFPSVTHISIVGSGIADCEDCSAEVCSILASRKILCVDFEMHPIGTTRGAPIFDFTGRDNLYKAFFKAVIATKDIDYIANVITLNPIYPEHIDILMDLCGITLDNDGDLSQQEGFIKLYPSLVAVCKKSGLTKKLSEIVDMVEFISTGDVEPADPYADMPELEVLGYVHPAADGVPDAA